LAEIDKIETLFIKNHKFSLIGILHGA